MTGAQPGRVTGGQPALVIRDAALRRGDRELWSGLNLDVQLIQPLHGVAKTIDEFRAALVAR